jgi:hypothetical protein
MSMRKVYDDRDDLVAVLQEVEEFLDQRADVDDGIPNDAMRLLVEVREVLDHVNPKVTS